MTSFANREKTISYMMQWNEDREVSTFLYDRYDSEKIVPNESELKDSVIKFSKALREYLNVMKDFSKINFNFLMSENDILSQIKWVKKNEPKKPELQLVEAAKKNEYFSTGMYTDEQIELLISRWLTSNPSDKFDFVDMTKFIVNEVKFPSDFTYDVWKIKMANLLSIIWPQVKEDRLKELIGQVTNTQMPYDILKRQTYALVQIEQDPLKYLESIYVQAQKVFPTFDKDLLMKWVRDITDNGRKPMNFHLLDDKVTEWIKEHNTNPTISRPTPKIFHEEWGSTVFLAIAGILGMAWYFRQQLLDMVFEYKFKHSIKGSWQFVPQQLDLEAGKGLSTLMAPPPEKITVQPSTLSSGILPTKKEDTTYESLSREKLISLIRKLPEDKRPLNYNNKTKNQLISVLRDGLSDSDRIAKKLYTDKSLKSKSFDEFKQIVEKQYGQRPDISQIYSDVMESDPSLLSQVKSAASEFLFGRKSPRTSKDLITDDLIDTKELLKDWKNPKDLEDEISKTRNLKPEEYDLDKVYREIVNRVRHGGLLDEEGRMIVSENVKKEEEEKKKKEQAELAEKKKKEEEKVAEEKKQKYVKNAMGIVEVPEGKVKLLKVNNGVLSDIDSEAQMPTVEEYKNGAEYKRKKRENDDIDYIYKDKSVIFMAVKKNTAFDQLTNKLSTLLNSESVMFRLVDNIDNTDIIELDGTVTYKLETHLKSAVTNMFPAEKYWSPNDYIRKIVPYYIPIGRYSWRAAVSSILPDNEQEDQAKKDFDMLEKEPKYYHLKENKWTREQSLPNDLQIRYKSDILKIYYEGIPDINVGYQNEKIWVEIIKSFPTQEMFDGLAMKLKGQIIRGYNTLMGNQFLEFYSEPANHYNYAIVENKSIQTYLTDTDLYYKTMEEFKMDPKDEYMLLHWPQYISKDPQTLKLTFIQPAASDLAKAQFANLNGQIDTVKDGFYTYYRVNKHPSKADLAAVLNHKF